MLRALLLAAVASCGFSPAAAALSTDAGAPAGDASDACAAGQTTCAGRDVRTCGSDGTWDPAQDHECDFTCASGACVVPSNVALPTVMACGPGAPALDPGPTGTVTYDNGGGAELTCSPACGTQTVIAPVLKANDVAWFCVSAIDLQPGATLRLPAVGIPSDALGFIVDGTAMIAGTIALDGGSAGAGTVGGGAAPGGFAGASKTDGPGATGAGAGGGAGGSQRDCDGTNWIGGGGGGGGSVEAGGAGGAGECQNTDTTTGGTGGPVSYSADLVPLVGGAGGGGGGDATSGGGFGWAGGGGGGALQISARLSIAVGGVISARGGKGYGVAGTIDGGGGGGAGGGVLLESPSIGIGGSVLVDGGDGGPSGAGPGGAGATGTHGPQPGSSFNATKQGGSGGGGGGGLVQLRSIAPVCGSGISPASACAAGMLTVQVGFDRLSATP